MLQKSCKHVLLFSLICFVWITLAAEVLASPRLKLHVEAAFDSLVVGDIINAVSTDELNKTIYELQENRDLDSPHDAYRSRYSLRVKQTDDPSDDACDNAAEYIFNTFKGYGLEVEYDPFPHEVLTQGHYEMRNVIATLPGKGINSEQVLIICAHYDSVASKSPNWLLNWKNMPAPGADDNASGTAAVLEAARILSEYDFDSTIKFIAFSGEELYWQGSIYYANLAAERKEKIAGVFNLDMIAYDPDAPDIDIVTNAGSEWLADAMLSVQRAYNIGPLLLKKIVNPEMKWSDHYPFWEKGYYAITGIDNSDFKSPEFYPFMHTAEDTVDRLNFEMASRMVQIVTGTLASLADPLVGSELHVDLAVAEKDIYCYPQYPVIRQKVQLTALVYNAGELDAQDALVQVWLAEPIAGISHLVAEESVDISAGGSTQISASLDFTEWGDYKVLVKANPDYKLFETNGGNNIAGRIIHVGSASLEIGKLMLYPNPAGSDAGDKINIIYDLSKDAATQLEIYDVSGHKVHQRHFLKGEPGGKFGPNSGINWDGTNQSGEKVASGVYFCYVVAEDEQGITKKAAQKFLIIR